MWGWWIFGAGMGGDTVSRQAAGAGPEVERAARRGGDPRVGDFPPAVSFSKVMRVARYGDPAVRFGNPNLRWGSPSYILEPGDPGYAIKVLSITLGDDWSDAWQATGLPDNRVGVPRTQDARFTALGGLKVYFTNHPAQEVSTAAVVVTAARATTLHTALSTAAFPPSKTTFA